MCQIKAEICSVSIHIYDKGVGRESCMYARTSNVETYNITVILCFIRCHM